MQKLLLVVILSVWFIVGVRSDLDETDIPELQYINNAVNPCDDFYEYACGNFKNIHPLTEGKLVIDAFTLLEDKLTELTNSILASPMRSEDPQALKKAKAAYQACVDISFVDKMVEPEKEIVDDEQGFPLVERGKLLSSQRPFGWNEIGDAVSKYGIQMIFNVQAYSDLEDKTKNLIYLTKDSLANPKLLRPYREPTYEEIIDEELAKLAETSMLKSSENLTPFDVFLRKLALKMKRALQQTTSMEEILSNIENMASFMRVLNNGGVVPENATIKPFSGISVTLKDLNVWTLEHFGDSAKIDWIEYMKKVFSKTGIEINEETRVLAYTGVEKLIYGILNWVQLNEDNVMKNFVMMRTFLYMAPDSDSETRQEFEEYYKGKNLTVPPRWQYCTKKIIDSEDTVGLSFAVAYEYQLRHFNVNNIGKAVLMIRDLQQSFKNIIQASTWMDDESKTLAVQKLENIVTILGYPDFLSNGTELDHFYENLRICKWDNYGNSLRIRAFKNAYKISKVAKRDRASWDKSPFEVNAYYNMPNNKIIFPVAMLNPIFFGSGNRIVDYGRIGSIIGHEITHGFDFNGRMYDQDGIMKPWWSSETLSNYNSKTECFVHQYSKYYVPEIDSYVNGTITLNENLADNGGTKESFRAMKELMSRTGPSKVSSDEFSPEQLFFIGFGTMWCNNPSVEYLTSLATDDHATSKWRVNGVVSNMEEFSQAFNCSSSSKMNPQTKCSLW